MARHGRQDGPATLHHVFNRGVARRTMFETRSDKRVFLSLLAKAVRRGEIRVHTFCLLTTHFHLLLRSIDGKLSDAMCQIQSGYSRYFNRTRKRDGPLVRSRFGSKKVRDDRYLNTIITYIEHNPIQARLAEEPSDYEFCSAHPSWQGRPWLKERWTSRLRDCSDRDLELIGARLLGQWGRDPLDELESFTPIAVLDWMRTKARLADGTDVGMPVCHPKAVLEAMTQLGLSLPQCVRARGADARSLAMRAGVLRDLSGLRLREIAVHLCRTTSTVASLLREHEKLMATDEDYSRMAAEVSHRALTEGPFRLGAGSIEVD